MKESVTCQELEIIPDETVMVQVLNYFTTPEEIEALEGELLGKANIKIPVKHGFCKGIATRQITLPAGTIAIGHGHTGECLNIVTAGSVSVVLDGKVKRITAPCQFVSPPFTRKVGYVHEDCTWITVHATDTKDIDELEKELIIKSPTYQRYELEQGKPSTDIVNCPKDEFWIDRVDYFRLLKEVGITHEAVRAQTENKEDQIPDLSDLVYIGSSQIQGSGVFSAFPALKGDVLAKGRIGVKRTPVGRYTNHARYPNCKFSVDSNGDISLVAEADVQQGEELTVDYRQALKAAKEANEILNLNTQ